MFKIIFFFPDEIKIKTDAKSMQLYTQNWSKSVKFGGFDVPVSYNINIF